MASVRASIVNQARVAATALVATAGRVDTAACPAVEQLLRCAALSEDAAGTLDWAAEILRSHGAGAADQIAYQLVTAARARLDARPVAADVGIAPAHSLAWI